MTWKAEKGSIVADLNHEAGDLLLMLGMCQKEFTHEIPVQKKIKRQGHR
jgi:alkylated DNA repair dioxygenase AlkB